jgi:hypothetical protein
MFEAATDPSISPVDPFPVVLSLAAILVSLVAVIVPAVSGKQQRLRDDRAKRAEMYLELIEIIERHGLWVTDRTYDLVETSDDDYVTDMPHRRTDKPDRTARVRARAVVSAYASAEVATAFATWQEALESFEYKLDVFAYTAQEAGPYSIDAREAEPLRDHEVSARKYLADLVNGQLVTDRRWRRLAK